MSKTVHAPRVRRTPSVPPAAPSAAYAALAGFLGAAVALGVGELFSGFSRSIPSLVRGVGDVFVDKTPGDATETALRTLGTNDKPFLSPAAVVAGLPPGAGTGVSGRRQRGSAALYLAVRGHRRRGE